jgi:hydroxymethylbilane synthase
MGGSCSVPLAAHAVLDAGQMRLDAAWGDPEGLLPLVQVQQTAPVSTLEQAEALGTDVARRLQAGGAKVCTNA